MNKLSLILLLLLVTTFGIIFALLLTLKEQKPPVVNPVKAMPTPHRINLTFYGDPATQRAVTWRTDASISFAYAQIAPATDNPKFRLKAIRYNADTEAIDINQGLEDQPNIVHYHSLVFPNLKPDTDYLYRVGGKNAAWSEWVMFRTAKAEEAPFEFVYFGDVQNDIHAHWSRVIRMAYQTAPQAAFALYAGDLVDHAHNDQEWQAWFDAGGFIHKKWTAVPVVGNHEYGDINNQKRNQLAIQWRPQFTLPREDNLPESLNETVYSVDYQGVRFIVLNSNENMDEQSKFLESKLKKNTAKWTIITFHHSVFAPVGSRQFKYAQQTLRPIFDRYNVDLVLNGHDHTYARGHTTPDQAPPSQNAQVSTVYITSISGPKMYEPDLDILEGYKEDGYYIQKTGEQVQLFQVIGIDGNRLTYKAYTATGALHDQFTLNKDANNASKTILSSK